MTEEGELAMLGEFYNRIEASMVRGLLESHGLECFAFDDYVRGGLVLDALGGTRLMVRAVDLEKAQKILAQAQSEAEDNT